MTCLFFISEDVKVLFCLGLMNTLIIDLNVSIQNNFKICGFVRGLPGFDMSPQFVYVLVFERKKKIFKLQRFLLNFQNAVCKST